MEKIRFITRNEETNHCGQFADKKRALEYAKRETRNTKRKHLVSQSITGGHYENI
jgi:hypothetical protein